MERNIDVRIDEANGTAERTVGIEILAEAVDGIRAVTLGDASSAPRQRCSRALSREGFHVASLSKYPPGYLYAAFHISPRIGCLASLLTACGGPVAQKATNGTEPFQAPGPMACGVPVLCQPCESDPGPCHSVSIAAGACSDLLRVDDKFVYGVSDGELWRVPKVGGDRVVLLATGPVLDFAVGTSAIGLVIGENVASLPLGGGSAKVLATDDTPVAVAVDGDWIYWGGSDQRASGFPGLIRRTKVTGDAAPETIWYETKSSPHGLMVRNGVIFWSDWVRGGIMRLSPGSMNPVLLARADIPTVITSEGDKLFFVDANYDPAITEVDTGSGSSRKLGVAWLAGSREPIPLQALGHEVYWLVGGPDTPNGLLKVREANANPDPLSPLLIYQALGRPNLRGLASDGRALYFGDCDGNTLERLVP